MAAATTAAPPPMEEEGTTSAPSHPPTHCCSACSFPVAAYGRLWPCRHAFCLACATGHALCFLCKSTVARVERTSGPLWISPVTLESFLTPADLEAHLAVARSRLGPIRVLPPPPAPGVAPPPGPQYPPMAPVRHAPPPPLPPGAPPVLALPAPAVGGAYGGGGGGAAGFPPPPQPGGGLPPPQ